MARQYRLLNPDGTFNVVRKGVRHRISRDVYHTLLSVSWPAFMGLLAGGYLITNALFALAYLLCGPDALAGVANEGGWRRYLDAFFFSVQTLATIGYGKITPQGIPANLLVTIEALFGLLGVALATGLLFSRFSRPTARITFSRVAMMAPHEGVLSLVFRMANVRLNQIVEAKVSVSLAIDEKTAEGEAYRNFYDLGLERSNSPIFVLSWTVVHPVNELSPLRGLTRQQLFEKHAEIIVSVTGIDETFSQAIHARYSYIPDEIIWGGYFEDILSRNECREVIINLERMHDYRTGG